MNRIRTLECHQLHHDSRGGCKLASLYEEAEQADRLFRLVSPPLPRTVKSAAISPPTRAASVCCAMAARAIWCWDWSRAAGWSHLNGLRSLRKDNTG